MSGRRISKYKLLLFVAAAVSSLSCGTSMEVRKTGQSSFSSSSSNLKGAECAPFAAAQGVSLAGAVTTFYLNGALQEDKIRLRISSVDAAISQPNARIQFFRWKTDVSGTSTLDSTPVSFYVTRLSDGMSISSALNSIGLSEVANLRSVGGIPGATAQEFFANTAIVLTGLDYSWNAAKIALYDGATTIGQADVLLPVFQANPNSYAVNRSPVLTQLHPFWAQRGTSMSEADWEAKARAYCF